MSERNDIDALMIGGLYDELDATDQARLESHLEGNPQARRELDALRRTRAALRELPEVDPPPALTAMLMHEAAKHVPVRRAAVVATPEQKGFFAWFGGLFQTLSAHPAAAAIATLVLVGGVAGTLYMRHEFKQAQPDTQSLAVNDQRNASAGSAAPAIAMPTTTAPMEAKDTFGVDLANEGDLSRDGDLRQQEEIAATVADPSKNAPARRGNADLEKDRWLEANAVSGTEPLLDGSEEAVTDSERARLALEVQNDRTEKKSEYAPKDKKVGGIVVDTPEPALRDEGAPVATGEAMDPFGTSDKSDKSKAKPSAPAKATQPPPPVTPGASGPSSGSGGAVYRAPAADDGGEDAKTVEWAKSQHTRLRTAFKGKKCADVARIANDILDRAPDYYLESIAGTKDVKGCQTYVNQEARKRGELRAKSRATRANPADADMEAAEPSME